MVMGSQALKKELTILRLSLIFREHPSSLSAFSRSVLHLVVQVACRLLSRTVSALIHDFVTLYSSTLCTFHKCTLNTKFWGWSRIFRGTRWSSSCRGHDSNPSWAGSSFKCSAWPEMQCILSDKSQSQANSELCSPFLIFGAFQIRPENYGNASDHFSLGASEVLGSPHWPKIPQELRFPPPEVQSSPSPCVIFP